MNIQSQNMKGVSWNEAKTIYMSPLSLGQQKKDLDHSLSKDDRGSKMENRYENNNKLITTHIIYRSNIMKTNLGNTFANRGMYIAILLTLFIALAFGQGNLVIQSSANFAASTGTYNIKGSITNAAAASVTGTVTMSGSAAQTIGTAGNGAINFTTLNISSASATTTANVSTGVSGVLTITGGSTYDIGATTLTLGGTPATTGTLNVGNGSSTVIYNGGSSQTIWGLSYGGALTLSGNGAKNLSGTTTVAGAFSHSGAGALTIDQNLTVSGNATFATITDVVTTKTLAFGGTGTKTINTVTTTTGTGTINNSGTSGLLTISTLNGNSGSILGGAGGVTFTNAATNAGTITGGAGLITFSNTLSHGTGTITAGNGGITFGNTVTYSSGTITSGTGTLTFSGNVANTSSAALTLTSSAQAIFTGSVNATGMNFSNGSTVTYNSGSAGQAIADVGYGNLTLSNASKTWTLGAPRSIAGNLIVNASSAPTVTTAGNALNVGGNVTLSDNLTMSGTGALTFANTTSSVSGTKDIIGTVSRTHNFSAATAYTFNNASTTVQGTATGANLTSFSLTSTPSGSPTGAAANHTIMRKFVQSYTNSGAFTVDIKLAYLSGEINGATEARLRDFQNGIVKANVLTTGAYTRVAAGGGFGTIDLPGIANTNITSGQELALDDRFYQFNSIASTDWKFGSTWDQGGAVPTQYDDVNITGVHNVTVSDAEAALSVTIVSNLTDVNTLTINNGASTFNVYSGGLTDNNTQTGGGLVVTAGTLQLNSGNLTINGNITNNGTITVQ